MQRDSVTHGEYVQVGFDNIKTSSIIFVPLQGMGEPLHNLEAVRRAISILCHPCGLQFSPNKVTVSTVGLVPEIWALAGSCRAQLAVSLHATTDKVRDWIAPVNRRQAPHKAMHNFINSLNAG